jgi:putative SOS response-associated peptidase YedK
MCGRFALRTPIKSIAKEFGIEEMPPIEARYNIAPTQVILSVLQIKDERRMKHLKWGLVPSWTKDASMGARLINARRETVAEKPAFREAFQKRRCLIPADGFYEWQRLGSGRKQPFFFSMRDERPFGFAGLWERWQGEDGVVIESCTILTTAANEMLRPVHDRMPVILHHTDYDLWLDEDVRKRDLRKELLQPYPASEMTSHPVSTSINSPRSQGVELIECWTINTA